MAKLRAEVKCESTNASPPSAMPICDSRLISYDDSRGAIADFLTRIDTTRVGVGVTRAVAWPHDSPYPASDAKQLLKDKLADLREATARVSDADQWSTFLY